MGRRRASGAHSAKRRQSGERLALFRVSISACFSFFLSGLCVHIEDSFAGSPPPPPARGRAPTAFVAYLTRCARSWSSHLLAHHAADVCRRDPGAFPLLCCLPPPVNPSRRVERGIRTA